MSSQRSTVIMLYLQVNYDSFLPVFGMITWNKSQFSLLIFLFLSRLVIVVLTSIPIKLSMVTFDEVP